MVSVIVWKKAGLYTAHNYLNVVTLFEKISLNKKRVIPVLYILHPGWKCANYIIVNEHLFSSVQSKRRTLWNFLFFLIRFWC